MYPGKAPVARKIAVHLLLLVLSLSPALAVAGGGGGGTAIPSYGGVDHTRRIARYDGPSTCMACHSTSKMGSSLAVDVFNSAHFQFRTFPVGVDMPGEGLHGMVDRSCGLPGTTMMANNYAYVATGPTGVTREDGCGKCHIAYRMPILYPSAQDAINDIDCLRCHAEVYGSEWDDNTVISLYGANPAPHERKVVTMTDNGGQAFTTWSQDRSLKTAQSVGNLPKSKYCLRCHEHGYTGYKRATPFEHGTDVHAAANVQCADCHVMQQHRIARGNHVTDMVANDLPSVEVTCSSTACHASAPHVSENAALLNGHIANVACEVCHIPDLPVENNIAARAWAPFTMNPLTGAWDNTPVSTTGFLYPGLYDAYMELYDKPQTMKYSRIFDAPPSVRWFNGGASMLAQPAGSYADRRSNGGNSRLFALKPFISGMLFDAGWLTGASTDNGLRLYSMKWFLEKNWDMNKAMYFVDPKYPTAADYWAARPDMAQMLNNFPMMLQFDRRIYLSEAGNVTGTPVPGPQDRNSYPGIAKAIDSGMAALGNTWSGSFFGMWVPPNMNDNALPIGSFITVSHAIQGAATMGTPCFNCHNTVAEYGVGASCAPKRVNFAAMGYPDTDNNGCVDPKYDNYQAPAPAVKGIAMAFSGRKTVTLTVTVTVVDQATQAPMGNVKVDGNLLLPGGTSLPYGGTTGTAGTATFTYVKTPMPTGTYTFTVTQLTNDGTAYPQAVSQTAVK